MGPYLALAASVGALATISEAARARFRELRTLDRARRTTASHPAWTYFDILAVGLLVAFAGLRDDVGTDFWIYEAIYENLNPARWEHEIATTGQEAGFTVLMLAVKSATDSAHAFFWVVAALTIVPVYAVIKRHSASPALSVLLYVLLAHHAGSFNAIRQSLAAAFLLLAWSFFVRDKKRWAVTLVVLATSVHLTAVFAAVALVLARRWKPTPATAVMILAGGAVAGLTLARLPFVVDWLTLLNPRYGAYLAFGEDTGIGAYLQIAANLALLALAVSLGRRRNPLSQGEREMVTYVLIGVAFMILGTQALVVFRMSTYFTVFLVLLVPSRLAGTSDKVVGGALVLAAASAYYAAHLTNYGDVIPYQTYLASG